MDKILPGLFLGNFRASEDEELLKAHGISHILVVGTDLPKYYPKVGDNKRESEGGGAQFILTNIIPQDFTYHRIEIADLANSDLISHFHTCTKFIDEGMKSGGVLVHWYPLLHSFFPSLSFLLLSSPLLLSSFISCLHHFL
jgi:hypothetical protein